MNLALLDDGRQCIVDSSRNQSRLVDGKEFFVSPAHVVVLLEGGWQVILRKRLRTVEYGSPFGVLKR